MSFTATELKSVEYWITSGANASGINALPAGNFHSALSRFEGLYGATGFWSSTPASDTLAHAFLLNYYCDYIKDVETVKTEGLSVRCVRN
jgi:uncharacterized protein (TIGR02145 family)